jgi:hypothetical protein
MSKTGQWVFEMQEDAACMSLSEFINKHGYSQSELWYEVNFGDERDIDPREAMMEGYYGS